MPDLAHLTAFLLAAAALALIPGPGMLYVLARSLGGGRRVGLRSSLGTGVGGTVHVLGAAFGLSALLATSAAAFSVVRYLGAAYLLWLGVRTVLGARELPPAFTRDDDRTDASAFRQGVLTEALNPKTALFFLTFLPQFCQPEHGSLTLQMLVLGAVSVVFNTSADIAVVFVAGPLGRRLRRSARSWRRQRVATGGVLVGLGVYAAVSDR
jgi:threonine/homoserine/homoserine lactone efflux protein